MKNRRSFVRAGVLVGVGCLVLVVIASIGVAQRGGASNAPTPDDGRGRAARRTSEPGGFRAPAPRIITCGEATNVEHVLLVLDTWGECEGQDCPADHNRDGRVDERDLDELLILWAWCPEETMLAPIPGLTTDWHRLPAETGVPADLVLELYQAVPPGATIRWSGAQEISRDGSGSTALCTVSSAGAAPREVGVDMAYESPIGIVRRSARCTLSGVAVHPEEVTVTAIDVTTGSIDLDPTLPPDELNPRTVDLWFGKSIAAVTDLGDGRYRTSVNRPIPVAVTVDPPEIAGLVEWRRDGDAIALGATQAPWIEHPGECSLEAGPVGAASSITVEAYRVVIDGPPMPLPEGEPITFTATTMPPGFEDEITWLSSTKYGTGAPVLGGGPTFTTQFDDVWGPHPTDEDAVFMWFGVKADHATVGQDGKFDLLPCCLPSGLCEVLTNPVCESVGGTSFDGACGETLACCLPDTTCLVLDPTCCELQGGEPRMNASCDAVVCIAPRACCVDRDCLELTPAQCEAAGGTTLGDGISCEAGLCDLGRCCFTDGGCETQTATECDLRGGLFTPGDECMPDEACCFVDGTCLDTDPSCCIAFLGQRQGTATACDSVVCCPDPGLDLAQSLTSPGVHDCGTPQRGGVLKITEVSSGAIFSFRPRFVELTNCGDAGVTLSQYSLGTYNNGDTQLGFGQSTQLAAGNLGPGETFVVAYEPAPAAPGFSIFDFVHGFSPDHFFGPFINGDDVVALFEGIAVGDGSNVPMVDVYGVVGVDGTGEAWEYTSGYAVSDPDRVPSSTFQPDQWFLSGPGALDPGPVSPDEACCFPDGSCQVLEPGCCGDLGGTPQGPDSFCVVGLCVDGRCCFDPPGSDCADISGVECLAQGGTFVEGAFCAPAQACCFGSMCEDLDPTCCTLFSGLPQGPGSTCATTPSCETGPECCLADGLCVSLSPAKCLDAGGTPGTGFCSMEACCLADGSCEVLDPDCCAQIGGFANGPGSNCGNVVCPPRCRYVVMNVVATGDCADCMFKDGQVLCGESCFDGGPCPGDFTFVSSCSTGSCVGTAVFQECASCVPGSGLASIGTITIETNHGAMTVDVLQPE